MARRRPPRGAGEGLLPPTPRPKGVLAGALNEIAKTGNRTRLLRFHAGARTTEPFVHDYWEEIYLLSGDLVVGDERSGRTLQNYSANTFACRPPGVYHGPFRSEKGCVLLEFHYYEQSIR